MGLPYRAITILPNLASWDKRITLFYDLEVSPITYDFCWAVAGAELMRRQIGGTGIDIIIVPGRHAGLRQETYDYEAVVDRSARLWRIDNILTPLARSAPTVESLTICSSRHEAAMIRARARHISPQGYWPAFPKAHATADIMRYDGLPGNSIPQPFHATAKAKDYVRAWLQRHGAAERHIIVITLRQYAFGSDRNSNLSAWAAFAAKQDTARILTVFVPDTEAALAPPPEGMKNLLWFPEGAHNLFLRHALYELADLNMMINNGPFGLCVFDEKCRYLAYKMLTESVTQTTSQQMLHHGFKLNETPQFQNRFQRWIWHDDTLEVIEREFEEIWPEILSAPRPWNDHDG